MSKVSDRDSLLDEELIRGVIEEDIEKVETLLKNGADPNRSKFEGISTLELAIGGWDFKMTSLLAKFGAYTPLSKTLQQTIVCAIRRIDDMFYYFIFKGQRSSTFFDPHSNAMQSRIVTRRPELVEALIAFGHDPQLYIEATVNLGTVENLKQIMNFCIELPENLPIGVDMPAKLSLIEQHMSRPVLERKEIAFFTLQSAKEKLAKNMLKFAHYELLNIYIALRILQIPVYVMLEIVMWLPNYDFFSAFQIVRVLEKIRKTLYK
jgi:hypothetical protein